MSFNPAALTERTLKQFVDRLAKLRKTQEVPQSAAWPPKRAVLQEEIAHILGFSSWHHAIEAVRPNPKPVTPTAPQAATQCTYLNEPTHWTGETFIPFLTWTLSQGASDILLELDQPIEIECQGQHITVTKRSLDINDIKAIFSTVSKTNLSINSSESFSYTLEAQEHKNHWRGHLVSQQLDENNLFIQISMQPTLITPPSLLSLGVPEVVENALNTIPYGGLILSVGRDEGDASTMLSSLVQHILHQRTERNVVTFEHPIEFEYNPVNSSNSVKRLATSRYTGSMKHELRQQVLKRRYSDIVAGRIFYTQTENDLLNEALNGRQVWASVQGNGCADAIEKMINMFPQEERRARAADLFAALRMVVAVQTVSTIDGKTMQLYETLLFDDELMEKLTNDNPLRMVASAAGIDISYFLRQRGMDFVSDARRQHAKGVISRQTLQQVEWRCKKIDL